MLFLIYIRGFLIEYRTPALAAKLTIMEGSISFRRPMVDVLEISCLIKFYVEQFH